MCQSFTIPHKINIIFHKKNYIAIQLMLQPSIKIDYCYKIDVTHNLKMLLYDRYVIIVKTSSVMKNKRHFLSTSLFVTHTRDLTVICQFHDYHFKCSFSLQPGVSIARASRKSKQMTFDSLSLSK